MVVHDYMERSVEECQFDTKFNRIDVEDITSQAQWTDIQLHPERERGMRRPIRCLIDQ